MNDQSMLRHCSDPHCWVCGPSQRAAAAPSLPAGAEEPLDGEAIAAEWEDRSETIQRLAKAYSGLVMEARTLRSTLEARERELFAANEGYKAVVESNRLMVEDIDERNKKTWNLECELDARDQRIEELTAGDEKLRVELVQRMAEQVLTLGEHSKELYANMELRGEVESLGQRIEELTREVERLDWLQVNARDVILRDEAESCGNPLAIIHYERVAIGTDARGDSRWIAAGDSLRHAIDGARNDQAYRASRVLSERSDKA